VKSSATSGYTAFTGEVRHACECSSATSSAGEDPITAEAFVVQPNPNQAAQTNQGVSALSHLLDGSAQSFWCSLPRDLHEIAGTCAHSKTEKEILTG
jgi:hypothetical protein